MSASRPIDDFLAAARATYTRLEPAEARAAMDEGAILVDTRCTEQREADGYVAGSVHIPLSILYWRLDPSSGYDHRAVSGRDRRLILMCAHGYSSSIAAATLRQLGFDGATDIVGGFEGWERAGLPVARLSGPQPDPFAVPRRDGDGR
ncbi:MAG: hypothetical protein RL338_53, partial [Chloroflexota bacterium]|jgi:rhodanese-related sulfurtransferase